MKDSIIKWVAGVALVSVIAIAAIFAVDNGATSDSVQQEKFQTLENKDEKQAKVEKDERLKVKKKIKREKRRKESTHLPPMMGPRMGPMMEMGDGFMPPMMDEGFQLEDLEILLEIGEILNVLVESIGDLQDLETVSDEIVQADDLTVNLIEEMIKATFEELIKEEFSELVDRVAEEAVNQIIEGLNNENLEQLTDEIVTTN